MATTAYVNVNGVWKPFGGSGASASKVSVTLSAASWTGDTAPYSYDLGAEYKDRTVFVTFDTENMTSDAIKAAQSYNIIGGGGSTLYAYGSKPAADIPVLLAVIG